MASLAANTPAGQRVTSRRGAPLSCADVPECGICTGPLPMCHEHVLDTERCQVLCLCLACSEVFRRPHRW